MLYHKPQHERFIRAVLNHGNQARAYRQAYPKASKESAYIGAIRLMQYPHIKERIEPALAERSHRQHQQALAAAAERQARQNEQDAYMRRHLARIIYGEVKKKRIVRYKGKEQVLQADLSPFLVLRAIVLDCRIAAEHPNRQMLVREFLRICERVSGKTSLQPNQSHHSGVNREQTLTNCRPNLLQETYTANSKKPECSIRWNNSGSDKIVTNIKAQNQEQTLTNCHPNPLQETIAANSKKPECSIRWNNSDPPEPAFNYPLALMKWR